MDVSVIELLELYLQGARYLFESLCLLGDLGARSIFCTAK